MRVTDGFRYCTFPDGDSTDLSADLFRAVFRDLILKEPPTSKRHEFGVQGASGVYRFWLSSVSLGSLFI